MSARVINEICFLSLLFISTEQEEDFAESFGLFIENKEIEKLNLPQKGKSKVKFFEQFPELVNLKSSLKL